MSDQDDWKVQASYKFGQTQHMLNVRGSSAEELNYHVVNLQEGETISNITQLGEVLNAAQTVRDVPTPPVTGGQAPSPWTQTGPPWGASSPPAPSPASTSPEGGYARTPAPTCHHGTKVFKSGVGAKGPWAAYFCPSPKGTPDQCEPDWRKA